MIELVYVGLLSLLALAILVPWLYAYQRDELDIFSPPLYKSLFMTATGLAIIDRLYIQERSFLSYVETPFEQGMMLVLGLHVLLFIAFLAGYYFIGDRPISSQILTSAVDSRSKLLRYMAVMYMLAGFAFYCLSLYSTIGADVFYLYQTTSPRSQLFADNYVYVAGASMLYNGYFLYLAGVIAERRLPNIFEISILPMIMVLYSFFGGRATTILIAVTSGIMLYYAVILDLVEADNRSLNTLQNSHPVVRLALLPLVVIIAAIGIVVAGAMRGAQTLEEAVINLNPIDVFTVTVQNRRFDNFVFLTEIVPEEIGYYYGAFTLRTFTHLIPSSLWEEKPVSYVGSLLRRIALPDQAGGRPAGEIGAYYINYGLPGIPLMALIYGMLMRVTYSTLKGNRYSPIAILLYAIILTSLGNSGLQNLVLTVLLRDLLILSPALLLHTLVVRYQK